MASDFIVHTGCMLQITMEPPETFPTMIAPLPLIGTSSDVNVMKMPACLEGDETPVVLLSPQPYMSPTYYTVPGMGMVTIKIGDSNTSEKTSDGGKPLLISGQPFDVEFDVVSPAMYINEASGVTNPDGKTKKKGKAQFININVLSKAG